MIKYKIRNIIRFTSKRRIKRAFSALFRGDFLYLYYQLRKFSEIDSRSPGKIIPLKRVLRYMSVSGSVKPEISSQVDILIPCYNGYEYLEPLFQSIKKNTTVPYRLIVIDDCSPDPRVWPLLQASIQNFPNAILLRNDLNKGFVKTVNSAAAYATGDFVLLNTDVEVPPVWLERLMAPILADRTIASATPFSNAATICSFPNMNEDNPLPSGLSADEVDHFFNQIPCFEEVALPTGVGFCMGINADIWAEIGGFDAEVFGRGYGEENDWCQRAISHGYRNIAVQNLFVYHKHGGSFESATREALREQNYRKLLARWPNYSNEVNRFIEDDPLSAVREALSLLIFSRGIETKDDPVLIVDHDIGGGTNTYRKKIIEQYIAGGVAVFLLIKPQELAFPEESLCLEFISSTVHMRFLVSKEKELIELFAHTNISKIILNNIVSYNDPLAALETIRTLKRITHSSLTVALHDFYALNPSYNLLDASGNYPGLNAIETLWRGIESNQFSVNPKGVGRVEWQTAWGGVLSDADTILCFSNNSRDHLVKVYPNVEERVLVRPHSLPSKFLRQPKIQNDTRITIAVVGGINRQKGSTIVLDLSKIVAEEKKNMRIVVVGVLEGGKPRKNVTITGPYKPEDLPDILEKYQASVCLLPSIWPETFSYVTEELMALDMPIVCFDLGAPAERLVNYPKAEIACERSARGAMNAIEKLHRVLSPVDAKDVGPEL
ncbi:glycosyltransferase [Brucella rhizosphaerae]|uniref:glycosyltransferase n=1 Tax=Brucella rhizosphaerae TaxID=571254 RepID=UPI0004B5CEC9|nr:glycosyltransferase [Brucella rhizosphaerae]